MNTAERAFWCCLGGAAFDIVLAFGANALPGAQQFMIIFLGSALAFALGAFVFWLNDQ